MKIISHRGNLEGRFPELENHPDYIEKAFKANLNVKVDIWVVDGKLMLGHDSGQHQIDLGWLNSKFHRLWLHAKNLEAVEYFNNTTWFNWFWHVEDAMTLTSKGYIWTRSGVYLPGGIVVEQEFKELPEFIKGVCTDFPLAYENYEKNRSSIH